MTHLCGQRQRRFARAFTLVGTAVFVLAAGTAAAQTGTVTGQVTDVRAQTPLTGVALQVDGTRLGAGTGTDGRFRITGVPAGTHTIVARRIGYAPARQSVTVTAGQEASVTIALEPSAIALDQIVVTGTAGEGQRRAIGNTVATISAVDELSKSAAPDVSGLLNARAPGVVVMPRTGRLGAGPSVQIRGRASLSLDNAPLIYIDGVRVNNSVNTGPSGVPGGLGGQGSQVGGRLNDISPEDIESMEIIKGPAAATIYGTEAANGVIQIITKRGAIGGRPQVSLQAQQGSLYFRDAEGRVPTNLMKDPSGNVVAWNGVKSEKDRGTPIFRTGQTRQYDGSVSGGGNQSRYYLAAGYENDLGIEPNNTLRQFVSHLNLDTQLGSSTDAATSFNYVNLSNRLGADFGASPLLGAEVGHALLFPANRGFFATPPEVPQYLYDNTTRVNRFTASGTVTNRPTTWFTQRAIVGIDFTGEDARAIERFAPPNLAPLMSAAAALGRIGQTLRNNTLYTATYNGTAKVNVTSAIGSSTTIGGQFYKTQLNSSFLGGTGFPGPGVETVSAVATQVSATQTQTVNTTIGAYGEQQFSWRDRLFVNAGLRVDNNSAFGEDFKWITYPKVGASWVVNEESWWRWSSVVDQLRLRAAYGESGRQPNSFAALRTFNPVPGPGGTNAVTPGSLGNPELKPERGKEIEVGFEASLFDRLTLDFTYFTKQTDDEIVNRNIAPSSGFGGTQVQNLGRVDNSGIELRASLQAIQRSNFGWEITTNLGTNKDEIISVGGVPVIIASPGSANMPGYPIGGIFSRVIVSADRNPTTGAAINVLCDGGAGKAPIACAQAPFLFLGTPTPKLTGSVSNTLNIGKSLRLYGLVDFKRGHKTFNTVEQLRCTAAVGAGLCEVNHYPGRFPATVVAQAVGTATAAGTTSQYYQDAAFTKLREISATYTLPQRWLRSRASITLAARELYTWTNYKGIDPEASTVSAATSNSTGDQATIPPLSRLIATFQITW
jgi:TonB-linked SusC/RagA family outer membrane protein